MFMLPKPLTHADIHTHTHTVRTIAMPQPNDPDVNPLQRDLADAIILMLPLDEIRILLACGAKASEKLCACSVHGVRP